MTMPAGNEREYTVVFDGDCRVCTRFVNALRAWDKSRTLDVVAFQAPGVIARYPWIPAHAYRESLQLVKRDGTTWQGAAAIEQILDVLPRGRLVSWLFRIPLVRPVADRAYRWFARNRYRLGCGAHCQVHPRGNTSETGRP
jgi:predicted DCC family thiol-disulfide oxidoreductase YuxK